MTNKITSVIIKKITRVIFEVKMGKPEKYTKEELVGKAVEMVREKGINNLGIRSLADYAGVSTQPICRHFGNVKELNDCVLCAINDLYEDFLKKEVQSGRYPPYKASGIGYVNFARKEPELFKALFMRSRKNEDGKKEDAAFDAISKKVADGYGIDYAAARKFHLMMWLVVHGIATQIATEYLNLSEADVSDILTESFTALSAKLFNKKQDVNTENNKPE